MHRALKFQLIGTFLLLLVALPGIQPLKASEEEETDNFEAMPNWRWQNETATTGTDEGLESGFFAHTLNNETSGTKKFEKSRGLNSRDLFFESRFITDSGGNQSEYFRDQKGDAADFAEGDQEGWVTFSGATVSVSNGILSASRAASDPFWGIQILQVNVSSQVYKQIDIRIRGSGVEQKDVLFKWFQGPTGTETISSASLDSTWQTVSFNLSSNAQWTGKIISLQILANTTSSGQFDIEFIELIGNLDFATHVEGEVEDTWDFEEGDDENYGSGGGLAVLPTAGGGGLAVRVSNGGSAGAIDLDTNTSIDTSLFRLWKLNVWAEGSGVSLSIREDRFRDNNTFTSSFPLTAGSFIDIEAPANTNWTGIEGNFKITFQTDDESNFNAGNDEFNISFILLLGQWENTGFKFNLLSNDQEELGNLQFNFHNRTFTNFTINLPDVTGEPFLSFTTTFQYARDEWLRLDVDIDLDEKSFKVLLEYDNGTDILKRTLYQLFPTLPGLRNQPLLFSDKTPFPRLVLNNSREPISRSLIILDFIDANYRIMDWFFLDENHPSVPPVVAFDQDRDKFEAFAPLGAYVEDTNTANTKFSYWYGLSISRLDGITFAVDISIDDFDASTDTANFLFYIFNISPNGSEQAVAVATSQIQHDGTDLQRSNSIFVFGPDDTSSQSASGIDVSGGQPEEFSSSFSFFPDYEENIFTVQWVTENPELPEGSLSGDWGDEDFTREFLVLFVYQFEDHDATDDDIIRIKVSRLEIARKDIISDLAGAVLNPVLGLLQVIFSPILFLGQILLGGLRLLGEFTVIGFELIIDGLETALSAGLGLIEAALATLESALETALTALGVLLEAAIEALEPFLTLITDAVEALWTLFIATLSDIVAELITLAASFVTFFFDILELLIPLLLTFLGTILGSIFGFIADIVFFVWDALALPNLLEILDFVLVGLVQFITGVPAFLGDLFTFLATISAIFSVLGFIFFFIVPIAQGANESEFLSHMFENMGFDITFGWTVLGVGGKFPIVIPWLLITIFTIFIGGPFAAFFS